MAMAVATVSSLCFAKQCLERKLVNSLKMQQTCYKGKLRQSPQHPNPPGGRGDTMGGGRGKGA